MMEDDGVGVIFHSVSSADQSCQSKNIVLADIETLDSETMSSEQNTEQMEPQVLGYLEVQPDVNVGENAMYTDGINFNASSPRFLVTRDGGSVLVVVNQSNSAEQAVTHLPQSTVLNSNSMLSENEDRTQTFSSDTESTSINSSNISCIGVIPNVSQEFNHTMVIQGEQLVELKGNSTEFSSQASLWTIEETKLQEKDDATEMLFFPDPNALTSNPEIATSLFPNHSDKSGNGNLMQLACIANEFPNVKLSTEVPLQTGQQSDGHNLVIKSDFSVQQQGQSVTNICNVRVQKPDNYKEVEADDSAMHKINEPCINHPELSDPSSPDTLSSRKSVTADKVSESVNDSSVENLIIVEAGKFKVHEREVDVSKENVSQFVSNETNFAEQKQEFDNSSTVLSEFDTSGQNTSKFMPLCGSERDNRIESEDVVVSEKQNETLLKVNNSDVLISDETIKQSDLNNELLIVKEVDNSTSDISCDVYAADKQKECFSLCDTKEDTSQVLTQEHFDDDRRMILDSDGGKSAFSSEGTIQIHNDNLYEGLESKQYEHTKDFSVLKSASTSEEKNQLANKKPSVVDKLNETRGEKKVRKGDDTDLIEGNYLTQESLSAELSLQSLSVTETNIISQTVCQSSKNMDKDIEANEVGTVSSVLDTELDTGTECIETNLNSAGGEELENCHTTSESPALLIEQQKQATESDKSEGEKHFVPGEGPEHYVQTNELRNGLHHQASVENSEASVESMMQPPKKTYTRAKRKRGLTALSDTSVHSKSNISPVSESSGTDGLSNSETGMHVATNVENAESVSESNEGLLDGNSVITQESSPSKKVRLNVDEVANETVTEPSTNSQDIDASYTRRKCRSPKSNSVDKSCLQLSDKLDRRKNAGKNMGSSDVKKQNNKQNSKLLLRGCHRKKGGEKKQISKKARVSKSVPRSVERKKWQNNLKKKLKTCGYDPSNEYIFSDNDETHDFGSYNFPQYSSTPRRQRGRPIGSRNRIVNNSETWNKFVNSSPTKIRNTRYLTKLKRRHAKFPSCAFAALNFPQEDMEPMDYKETPRVIVPKKETRKKVFGVHYMEQQCESNKISAPYSCMTCQYETDRLQNFIFHTKICLANSVQYRYDEISDMDKRQRIRGELQNDQELYAAVDSNESDASSRNFTRGECPLIDHSSEKHSCNNIVCALQPEEVSDYNLLEDDVVWAGTKDGFWPAWVHRVYPEEKKASVYFINFPDENNYSDKAPFKNLLTFHEAELNKRLLREARSVAEGEMFLKAVQKAEEFIRKKKCLGIDIAATEFFHCAPGMFHEENLFACQSMMNRVFPPKSSVLDAERAYQIHALLCEQLNLRNIGDGGETPDLDDEALELLSDEIVQFIVEGRADKHIVGVLRNETPSFRHRKFFSGDYLKKNALIWRSWFGPVGEDSNDPFHAHFYRLLRKIHPFDEKSHLVTYIYLVVYPEAIVKAISIIKDLSHEDAEELFEKTGVSLALKHFCR